MSLVRRATLDDLEAMVSVYTAAWRQGFQHMFGAATFVRDDFAAARDEECRQVLMSEETDTFVVENDCSLTGFAAAAITRSGADLQDIWLHPNAWGTGAAARLVTAVEDQARSAGAGRLTAWIPEDSPSGRRFFDKLGWRPTGATELLGLYVEQPNRLFEYEHEVDDMDMTRGVPRPAVFNA